MVNQSSPSLDLIFSALADGTRRDVLERLGEGPLSVSELAAEHEMSLPGFMKHLAVLEAAGLIAKIKEGRVVRCELEAAPMQEAAMWVSRYEKFWNERLDALGRYLYHQEETQWKTKKQPKSPPPSSSDAPSPSPRKKSGGPGPTRKR